jgi:branched-chain amino acid transport system permease protein
MQQVLNGIFAGSIYALFAIGFTLVFSVLDRLNLAHAAVFTTSAYVGIELVADLGLSIWLAIPAVLVTGPCSGWSSSGWPSAPSRAGTTRTSPG